MNRVRVDPKDLPRFPVREVKQDFPGRPAKLARPGNLEKTAFRYVQRCENILLYYGMTSFLLIDLSPFAVWNGCLNKNRKSNNRFRLSLPLIKNSKCKN